MKNINNIWNLFINKNEVKKNGNETCESEYKYP